MYLHAREVDFTLANGPQLVAQYMDEAGKLGKAYVEALKTQLRNQGIVLSKPNDA